MDDTLVYVIRWTSECDAVRIRGPITRSEAIAYLRDRDFPEDLDLQYAETGRLASWVAK